MLFELIPQEELLKQAEVILRPWLPEGAAAQVFDYTQRRIKLTGNGRLDVLDLEITPDDLLAAVTALLDNDWGYLATITGIDLGVEDGHIEVLYHFCQGTAVVTLCLKLPRENAIVPSVCGIIPSASFYERELLEMLGVTITNTPNTAHLFLPDNWPDDTYPLRKDFIMHSHN